ncbi:MAG: DUF4058 family protein [Gemmataceae bacterium]|nr:DUF4058 family protein [Gemmataceae bacterium]
MPIHDWSKVSDGTFHAFHLAWIAELQKALNRGLLPKGFYARAEQTVIGMGPDVLTLADPLRKPQPSAGGGTATLVRPRTAFSFRVERAAYTAAQRRVVIRHSSDHRVVAMIELVSAGNKSSQHAFDKFVEKAAAALSQGVHLLVVDLHAPTPRDPKGIHTAIWEAIGGEAFDAPEGRPLTLASYEGEPLPEAHVEPTAIGVPMPDMPLCLGEGLWVEVPLERTYQEAWAGMPDIDHEALG